jgi:excisionase family DNA binding protein
MRLDDSTAITLTAAAAARYLGVGKRQMLALLHAGTIPAVRMGRQLRVLRVDLDSYVDSLPPVATVADRIEAERGFTDPMAVALAPNAGH